MRDSSPALCAVGSIITFGIALVLVRWTPTPHSGWTWLLPYGTAALLAAGVGIALRQSMRARSRTLQRTQATLSRLMGNLPGMVYSCRNDAAWTMEFVSEGCQDLCGFDPAQLTGEGGHSYASLIHPADRDRVWRDVQAAVSEGRRFEVSYRLCLPDGRTKWVWEKGCEAETECGETRLEGFVVDVTEERNTREELRSQEAGLRKLVENIHMGVCLLDEARCVTLFNQEAVDHLSALSARLRAGAAIDRIGGSSLEDLLPQKSDLATREVRTPGDPPRLFEVACHSISDEAGGGYVLLTQDLTDAKLERERLDRNTRLAEVGQLAAGIAHDFNNLLTVVIGSAQLLELHKDVPARLKQDLRNIHRAWHPGRSRQDW